MKETNKGWIPLQRSMMDDPAYFAEKFCRNMAWVDLQLLTNHSYAQFYVRDVLVDVKPGQTAYSAESLAKRWKWSRGKVVRYLSQLEKTGKIIQHKNPIITKITIVGYNERFQVNASHRTTDAITKRQDTEHQTDTNNNANKDNNDENDKHDNINSIYKGNLPVGSSPHGLHDLQTNYGLEYPHRSQTFRDAWELWKEHMSETYPNWYGEKKLREIFAQLKKEPEPIAIAGILEAIVRGFAKIFPITVKSDIDIDKHLKGTPFEGWASKNDWQQMREDMKSVN